MGSPPATSALVSEPRATNGSGGAVGAGGGGGGAGATAACFAGAALGGAEDLGSPRVAGAAGLIASKGLNAISVLMRVFKAGGCTEARPEVCNRSWAGLG